MIERERERTIYNHKGKIAFNCSSQGSMLPLEIPLYQNVKIQLPNVRLINNLLNSFVRLSHML